MTPLRLDATKSLIGHKRSVASFRYRNGLAHGVSGLRVIIRLRAESQLRGRRI